MKRKSDPPLLPSSLSPVALIKSSPWLGKTGWPTSTTPELQELSTGEMSDAGLNIPLVSQVPPDLRTHINPSSFMASKQK